MSEIVMLGTGMGATLELYNTCFLIKNGSQYFLVDTGGSIEIVSRLEKIGVELNELHHIFVSHNHSDHILGLIWIFKKLASIKKIDLTIYCNDLVYDSIIQLSEIVLPKELLERIFQLIHFHILSDQEVVCIEGINYHFFDIHAKGPKQYGFDCLMENQKLFFLGDEPLNQQLYNIVQGADYVMHEAFCLDSEKDKFRPYEKNHSTAMSTCQIMDSLGVKNVILYHTEETHGTLRKKLYIEEGRKYFKGRVFVPNDMERISFD